MSSTLPFSIFCRSRIRGFFPSRVSLTFVGDASSVTPFAILIAMFKVMPLVKGYRAGAFTWPPTYTSWIGCRLKELAGDIFIESRQCTETNLVSRSGRLYTSHDG